MDDPMTSLVRAQQEAAARFARTWGEIATTAATAAASGGVADPQRQFQEQFEALTRSVTDYATAAAQPLRDLAAGQREFADRMARWAELQRELADSVATWADQQRRYADTLDRMVTPFGAPPGPAGEQV